MKQKIFLLLFLIAGTCFSVIQAQQVKQVTIIDELEKPVQGEGVVKVTIDPKIKELIGLLSPEISTGKDSYIKTRGFRIQVFMSSDPTAKRECVNKGNTIKRAFPDVDVYEQYNAPNWRLFAGDFLTKEEAEVFRQKLLRTIPELGREMYVVQDIVNVPIHKTF